MLKAEQLDVDIVLGLPRGGVIVAAEVATVLQKRLDVLVVRKIGHPLHREFAVGAMAEAGVVLLDDRSVSRNPIWRSELDGIINEEQDRLESYEQRFHMSGPPALEGKAVLIVDDGLATGATAEAAAIAAKKKGCRFLAIAAPVASTNAVERLLREADEVRAILIDPEFDAVGRYYAHFEQATDEDVLAVLSDGRAV
jgi:predicted phosphoribosyltransferase